MFGGPNFSLLTAFMPYGPTVTNGVNVQLADANQDGVLDIQVTVQGGGYASLVAFSGATGQTLALSTGGEGTNSSPDPNQAGDVGDFEDFTNDTSGF